MLRKWNFFSNERPISCRRNQYIRYNGKDTLFKKVFLDSTGTVVVPTGAVKLGFCETPADTSWYLKLKQIVDTLSSINSKEALNNQKNDTIIKRLDSRMLLQWSFLGSYINDGLFRNRYN